MILITEPNFVLGEQATFSHEFEAHNDLRPLQSHCQLACVAKTASTDICQIPGLLKAIFRPIEARYNEDRLPPEWDALAKLRTVCLGSGHHLPECFFGSGVGQGCNLRLDALAVR